MYWGILDISKGLFSHWYTHSMVFNIVDDDHPGTLDRINSKPAVSPHEISTLTIVKGT